MEITREAWKEIKHVLAKYKIPYVTHYEESFPMEHLEIYDKSVTNLEVQIMYFTIGNNLEKETYELSTEISQESWGEIKIILKKFNITYLKDDKFIRIEDLLIKDIFNEWSSK